MKDTVLYKVTKIVHLPTTPVGDDYCLQHKLPNGECDLSKVNYFTEETTILFTVKPKLIRTKNNLPVTVVNDASEIKEIIGCVRSMREELNGETLVR